VRPFDRSDPRLLEQMIRNLLSNALKYTKRGKVLLGLPPAKGMLSIEVWDTGIGIPDEELQAIFEEYHQLDNAARERSRGLGLGLSIVQRLGNLLGHRVRVRSRPGKGSVFAIEVALPAERDGAARAPSSGAAGRIPPKGSPHRAILVVEDDPEVRELLELSSRTRAIARRRRRRRRGAGIGGAGRSGPTSSSPTTICRTA
jgi:two-component system CheB/CheR fusion protein